MTKSSNFRIRFEPELHQRFLGACKAADKPAAQVARELMRAYVANVDAGRQTDFFSAQSVKKQQLGEAT